MKVVLVGATGLVGGSLLELLEKSDKIESVVLLSRRKTNRKSTKIVEHVVDFEKPDTYSSLVQGDAVFCCLGTTIKVAGSKENFIKVDYTYPYEVAKAAIKNNVSAYHIVTSLGASASSSVFYSKVKGDVQESIRGLGFKTCCFYQPSMLLGERKESRPAEKIGQVVMSFFNFLIPKSYKAISGLTVAKAMLNNALNAKDGVEIIPSSRLFNLAENG